ncbi:MAG: HAD family hydrolase [Planctomycetota bacterium]
MSKAAFLLDLDGTLVDSLADIAASVNHVRAELGLPPLAEAAVRAMVGDGARMLLTRALAELPSPPSIDSIWPLYQEHHRSQCTKLVRPYPGVVDTLCRWRTTSVVTAIVTNKPVDFALRIVESLELPVDEVIGGDSTSERKPSPVPLQLAMQRLRKRPQECAMVGDGVQDLRAGKAAGVHTIAVLYGFRDESELRAEGADEYWRRFGGASSH